VSWVGIPCNLLKSSHIFRFIVCRKGSIDVLQYLLIKSLRKKNASLVAPFTWSEDLFLSKYDVCFKDESDYLLKLYEENMKLRYTKEYVDMPSPNKWHHILVFVM
jgi:hypothetical protein